jgi:hypothetical protein
MVKSAYIWVSFCLLCASQALRADDIPDEAHRAALAENCPLIMGVGPKANFPAIEGTLGCNVESFPKAEPGDYIVFIPFKGTLYRVWNCQPGQAIAVQQSWDEPDALAEVNAARAARGLRPFIRDAALTAAAQACAKYRAERRIAGHTSNDFAFVPSGALAQSAGCAAWPPHLGWGSCCYLENWTYAGASFAIGGDGLRYMHIFVR